MSGSRPPQIAKGSYYIDTSVLLNLLAGYSIRIDSRAAKDFMKEIARGPGKAIVSTWSLLEMISVIRRKCLTKGIKIYGVIEQTVVSALSELYKLRNTFFQSGTPMELAQVGKKAPELWEVMEEALEVLENSAYQVVWNPHKKKDEIDGVASNDALHIATAQYFGCDYLATFDSDFWADTHQIAIYDVRGKQVR